MRVTGTSRFLASTSYAVIVLAIGGGIALLIRMQWGIHPAGPSSLVLRDLKPIRAANGSPTTAESAGPAKADKSRGRVHQGHVPFAQLTPDQQVMLLNNQIETREKPTVSIFSAISTFHAIIAARPTGSWPKDLVTLAQCEEILSLSREQIQSNPENPAQVSDSQRGIVEALACEGKPQAALPEAKRYFEVASLKSTANAISLMADLLSETGRDVVSFESQQRIGASIPVTDSDSWSAFQATLDHAPPPPSILQSVSVAPSQYAAAIEKVKDTDTYDGLMARGNLLLLSDSPEAAQPCFLEAGKIAGKNGGKKLFAAVEGVLKAIRDQTGTIGVANAVEFALKSGKPETSLFPADSFDIPSLQVAGGRLDRAALPESFFSKGISTFGKTAVAMVTQPQPESKLVGADRALIDPVVLAKSAPVPDMTLIAWLGDWKKEQSAGISVSSEERNHLRSILEKTTETSIQLFPMAHSVHLRATRDLATPSIVYQAASVAAENELGRVGHTGAALDVLHAMNDHMEDYKGVMWPLIDAEPRDLAALNALCRIYSNLVVWTVPEDASLAKTITHVKIGLAECLCLQGSVEDAISLLHSIHVVGLSSGEYTAYSWAFAVSLYRDGRYADAVQWLERAAIGQNVLIKPSAQRLLVFARARIGDITGANLAFDQWVRTCRPTPKQASPVLAFIHLAETNSTKSDPSPSMGR
jgi:hypothetical protein